MRIYVNTIFAIILYHALFINLRYIEVYPIIQKIFIICLILYIFINIKYINKNKYKRINILVYIYTLAIIISGLLNKNTSNNNTLLSSIMYSLTILTTFLAFEYIEARGWLKKCMKIFFKLTLVYSIFNDAIIILIPKLFILKEEVYFLGNKFSVAYFHLMLYIFYKIYIKINNKKDKFSIVFFVWALVIAIHVKCTTATLGCCLILIINILNYRIKRKLMEPLIAITSLIICDSILIINSKILSYSVIQNFIVNILNKDITLTGRLNIYENLFNAIKLNPIWGVGYNNSYPVLMKMGIGVNAQNGILENIIQFGIIGTIILLLMIIQIFINCKKGDFELTFIIISIVYVLFFISSVEITLGLSFLNYLAIANSISMYKKI